MISTIAGEVSQLGLEHVVVSLNGVGVKVFSTPNAVGSMQTGQAVCLHTTLIVREDSLTLYGFLGQEERDTFDILLTISGIGPRLALACLAVLTPGQLAAAIASEDYATLQRIPGVGRKSAGRIVLEVGDKLRGAVSGDPLPTKPVTTGNSDVTLALVNLGWQEKTAAAAVDKAMEEQPDLRDLGAILRRCLQILGGS